MKAVEESKPDDSAVAMIPTLDSVALGKDISIINSFLDPCKSYVSEYPLWAIFYGVLLITFSLLTAYKCKGLTGRCRRRRNRRRRKTSRTYYYLNKSAAENAAENISADPFLQQEV